MMCAKSIDMMCANSVVDRPRFLFLNAGSVGTVPHTITADVALGSKNNRLLNLKMVRPSLRQDETNELLRQHMLKTGPCLLAVLQTIAG